MASAKQSYQEDAHTTAGRLQAATDSAIPADSWWEKLTNSDAWKVLVTVATVVVVVAAVAGLFLSGPAGWIAAGIAFGAGALLTADDIAEYAKGNMSTGQFLLAMGLNFIPGGAIAKGGKALAKGVGAIARGAGRVAAVSDRVGRAATHAAHTVVAGSKKAWNAGQRAGDRISAATQRAWDGAKRSVRNDPIYQGVLSSGRHAIDNATDLLARASGQPALAHAGAGAERSATRITGDLHDGAHTRQATTPDTNTGTGTGTGSHGHGDSQPSHGNGQPAHGGDAAESADAPSAHETGGDHSPERQVEAHPDDDSSHATTESSTAADGPGDTRQGSEVEHAGDSDQITPEHAEESADVTSGPSDALTAEHGYAEADIAGHDRTYLMADGSNHVASFPPEQLGQSRVTDELLDAHNVSRETFVDLVNKPVTELTARTVTYYFR